MSIEDNDVSKRLSTKATQVGQLLEEALTNPLLPKVGRYSFVVESIGFRSVAVHGLRSGGGDEMCHQQSIGMENCNFSLVPYLLLQVDDF